MTYTEYKDKRQDEFNALPIFYAFSDEQFYKQLERFGLTAADTNKVCRVGLGGFCLVEDLPKVKAYMDAPDPLNELLKDPEFAEDAFYYEMANHEYHINWEGDWDVCNCFGNIPAEEPDDLNHYFDLLEWEPQTRAAYLKARSRFLRDADERGWY